MTFSTRPLEGRVVLVTGGGRGIGRSHALAFAALGAKVIVNDYGGSASGSGACATPAEEVAEEIRANGGAAAAHFGDVSSPADAAAAVALAIDTFGKLDTLVNNAGFLRDKSLLNMSLDDWAAVVDVHLRGTFVMTQAAGRYWQQCAKDGNPKRARIVNTASGSGLFGNFGQANYSAAKGGIASLTTLSAIELGRYGVTANCIAPAARTRLVPPGGMAEQSGQKFDPFDPDNVSPFVTWLGSDRSADVTGRLFTVVGGFVGVVEGYLRGPSMHHDRKLTFEDIDAEMPGVIAQARPRTTVPESHPYFRTG